MGKLPEIYTQEVIVFKKLIKRADTKRPVNVYTDTAGNHAVANGNHRSVKAFLEGTTDQLPRHVIGHLNKDVSKDPYYRHVSEVKMSEADPPYWM